MGMKDPIFGIHLHVMLFSVSKVCLLEKRISLKDRRYQNCFFDNDKCAMETLKQSFT